MLFAAVLKRSTRLEETLNDERIHCNDRDDGNGQCNDRIECIDNSHRLIVIGIQSALLTDADAACRVAAFRTVFPISLLCGNTSGKERIALNDERSEREAADN